MALVLKYRNVRTLKRLAKKPDWIDFKPTKDAEHAYAIAAKHEGRFASAFMSAIRAQLPDKIPDGFRGAMDKGVEQTLAALPLMDLSSKKSKVSTDALNSFIDRMTNAYLDVIRESGQDASDRVNSDLHTNFRFTVSGPEKSEVLKRTEKKTKPKSKPKSDDSIDDRWLVPIVPVNPYAKRWVAARCMELVTDGITAKQWTTAKAIIEDGFKRGLRAEKLYGQIKQNIGLLPREYQAVINRQELMESQGFTEDKIEREKARYSEELLKKRAERIGRTETIQAQAEGRREMWRTANESGNMPAVEREWISAPESDRKDRPCEICVEMHGRRAPVDGMYDGPDGPIEGPTAHPSCRCTEKLVRASEA